MTVIAQAAQITRCPPYPVRKDGSVKLNAPAGHSLGLPVKRQVIGIFGYQHQCDQRLREEAAYDDPAGAGA